MIVNDTVKTAVAEGAKFLDAHFGKTTWRKDINVVEFDIDNGDTCIIGQLFGSYDDGIEELGISYGYKYGFASNFGRNLPAGMLDFEWKRVINEGGPKYKVGDNFTGKWYTGSKTTIKGVWTEGDDVYYGVHNLGSYGRGVITEKDLDDDWTLTVPFPFKKGDILRDTKTGLHLFLVVEELTLWRLAGQPMTRTNVLSHASYDSYTGQYGTLEALESVAGVKMSEKLA